jgi:putative PIN family toxin of toxin-antitoxin system
MTKVVLDTNIFISATFWKGKPYRIVRKAASREIRNYTSLDILAEFNRVLKRDFGVDDIHADQAVNTVLLFSTLVEPKIRHKAIKDDPDDNKIIDCGVAARADCIISQDKHLLNLKRFNNILILTPNDFLTGFGA